MNIADASVWLANHARVGLPIGVDIQARWNAEEEISHYVIAFAGRTEGDEVVFDGVPGDDGIQMLRRFLDVKDGIKLVPFSTPEATVLLHLLTDIAPSVILQRIVGDAFALEYTIGRGHNITDDPILEARYAVTFWLGGEAMTLPKFYKAIMAPLQRIMAVPLPSGGHEWQVRYSELPIKVIAKYSHEPLLMRSFMEEEYPAHGRMKLRLADDYPEITHAQTYAALWYAALGGDYDYMQKEYPSIAEALDGFSLETLGHVLDKHIPAVRLTATTLWQAGGPARQVETLYGRRLPFEPDPGMGPGIFLDHVIGGTVIDLIHVFCVSAANLGLSVNVPFLGGSETTIDVSGKMDGDVYERANQLKAIAALGGPLNPVPLGPVVMLEGEDGKGFKAD